MLLPMNDAASIHDTRCVVSQDKLYIGRSPCSTSTGKRDTCLHWQFSLPIALCSGAQMGRGMRARLAHLPLLLYTHARHQIIYHDL